MNASIFTPAHGIKYLLDAYHSIKDQDFLEWVIFPNNGLSVYDIPEEIREDERVVFVTSEDPLTSNIGALKRIACSACEGDLLIEFDFDDLMVPGALDKIKEAFEDPDVVFVYSNCAQFNNDDKSSRFFGNATIETNEDTIYGWKYQDYEQDGVVYKAAICPEADPYHCSIILFAPDHVRAFRRDAYERAGGYDASLSICDDQDLMCRLYLQGKFKHINECLYLYRVTGENSWLKRNAEIQSMMLTIQKKYVRVMTKYWAEQNNLPLLDFGGRFNCPLGYLSVDLKDADIICDLNERLPFEDSSIGVIRAFDILEHLKDPIHVMSEIYRVLVPGGYLLSQTPSTDGRGAWMDPTHISFFNEGSFWYYTKQSSAQYIDIPVRFKSIVLETEFPNDWARENNIPYVRADLISLKGYRPHGLIEI